MTRLTRHRSIGSIEITIDYDRRRCIGNYGRMKNSSSRKRGGERGTEQSEAERERSNQRLPGETEEVKRFDEEGKVLFSEKSGHVYNIGWHAIPLQLRTRSGHERRLRISRFRVSRRFRGEIVPRSCKERKSFIWSRGK